MDKIITFIHKRTYIVLFIIVFLGFLLRFINLSSLPISLYWDEVSIGYNAYSILETQRDEYGEFLPLLFRGYNDYKLPFYIYSVSLSEIIFGLSAFAVRFPSALSGTLSIIIVFFLCRVLLAYTKMKKEIIPISLLTSFLFAISPWSIQFSRAGFEANLALFFLLLGIFFFFKSFSNSKLFLLSTLFFVLSLYTYRSTLIFLPLFIIPICFVWRKELLRVGMITILSGSILFVLLVSPLVARLSSDASSRFNQTSIVNEVDQRMLEKYSEDGVIPNRKLVYTSVFTENFLLNLSPSFLFTKGDPNPRHTVDDMGMMYLWSMPFLLLGFYAVLFKFSFKVKAVFVIWVIAAIIPSALSIPSPHALRTLNILPIPQLLVALGIIFLYRFFSKKTNLVYIGLVIFLAVFSLGYFVNKYIYSHMYKSADVWGDGYRQLVTYVEQQENNYDKIIITGHYWQPYMYFLFYTKYSPSDYQKSGSDEGFGKYLFGGTAWDLDRGRSELNTVDLRRLAGKERALFVLSPEEYADQRKNLEKVDRVYDSKGEVKFIIGEI